MEISRDSKLVCLVGENGTGKSNLLELVSAAANQLGMAPEFHGRGNAFDEEHELELTVEFSKIFQTELFGDTTFVLRMPRVSNIKPDELMAQWDGTLTLFSVRREKPPELRITAGGISGAFGHDFVKHLTGWLRVRADTFCLFLNSDRAYPPAEANLHALADGMGRNWDSTQFRKNRSTLPPNQLYEDFLNYCISREGQRAAKHYQMEREADHWKIARPAFEDPFQEFGKAIKTVLPHLRFSGVDTEKRTLVFDAGNPLTFNQLSGGEREICFLVGQIERFQLKRGLFLVDEPELHLNSSLLRTWISFLRDSVEDGQTWIATHSLEAVEVAGLSCTFLLQRSETSRRVERIEPLVDKPAFSVLSGALGSPAFSLTKSRFIFIEGERGKGERDRFHKICGNAPENKFLEAGGCTSVESAVEAVRNLTDVSGSPLRVGGMIDRDFRSESELGEIEPQELRLFILPCHEVENLFLHPTCIAFRLERLGRPGSADELILQASDRYAGAWIFSRTVALNEQLRKPCRPLKGAFWKSTWTDFGQGAEVELRRLVQTEPEIDPVHQKEFLDAAIKSVEFYEKVRQSPALWRDCMGKEVLRKLTLDLGYRASDTFESEILQAWKANDLAIPEEVAQVRKFVESL